MSNDKCHCKHYEGGDQRSPLIKLDIPEYEEYRYGGASHLIFRAIRIICCVTVVALLSYSLWRIRAIESKIEANDRWSNLSRIIQNSNVFHKRASRSIIKDQMLMNSFGDEKGTMAGSAWKKPTNKSEFDELVNDLFDKIKAMHEDQDRGHFDRNMKAVFQSWFPVFDALLPSEFKGDTGTRKTRDVAPQEEYFYKPSDDKSTESNSAESDKTILGRKKEDSLSSDESDLKDSRNYVPVV